jgi:hypothetical protein
MKYTVGEEHIGHIHLSKKKYVVVAVIATYHITDKGQPSVFSSSISMRSLGTLLLTLLYLSTPGTIR